MLTPAQPPWLLGGLLNPESRVSGNAACCAAHTSSHCLVTLCSFVKSRTDVLSMAAVLCCVVLWPTPQLTMHAL